MSGGYRFPDVYANRMVIHWAWFKGEWSDEEYAAWLERNCPHESRYAIVALRHRAALTEATEG